MKNYNYFVFILLFGLSGCTTTLPKMPNVAMTNLAPDISTKKDVFHEFGQPHDVINLEAYDNTIWIYYDGSIYMNPIANLPYIVFVAGGVRTNIDVIKFTFDEYSEILKNTEKSKHEKWIYSLVYVHQSLIESYAKDRVESEMERLGLPFNKYLADEFNAFDNYIKQE